MEFTILHYNQLYISLFLWSWNAVGAQKLIVGWFELHFHAPAETKNSLQGNIWNASFSDGSAGKEFTCKVGDPGDMGSIPWLGRFPWRRKWQPTPVFLPEKSHGQGNLPGYCPMGHGQATKHASFHRFSFLSSFPPSSLPLSLPLSLSFLKGLPLSHLITLLQTTCFPWESGLTSLLPVKD